MPNNGNYGGISTIRDIGAIILAKKRMIHETFIRPAAWRRFYHHPHPEHFLPARSSTSPGTLFAGPFINFTRNLVCRPVHQLHPEPCLPALFASGNLFFMGTVSKAGETSGANQAIFHAT
jgi:hypothetical protein